MQNGIPSGIYYYDAELRCMTYLGGPNYHGTPQHDKPRPRVIKTVIPKAGTYIPDDDTGGTPRSYDVEVRDTVTNVTVDDILKRGEG